MAKKIKYNNEEVAEFCQSKLGLRCYKLASDIVNEIDYDIWKALDFNEKGEGEGEPDQGFIPIAQMILGLCKEAQNHQGLQ